MLLGRDALPGRGCGKAERKPRVCGRGTPPLVFLPVGQLFSLTLIDEGWGELSLLGARTHLN